MQTPTREETRGCGKHWNIAKHVRGLEEGDHKGGPPGKGWRRGVKCLTHDIIKSEN